MTACAPLSATGGRLARLLVWGPWNVQFSHPRGCVCRQFFPKAEGDVSRKSSRDSLGAACPALLPHLCTHLGVSGRWSVDAVEQSQGRCLGEAGILPGCALAAQICKTWLECKQISLTYISWSSALLASQALAVLLINNTKILILQSLFRFL